jgi:hypothetical protein
VEIPTFRENPQLIAAVQIDPNAPSARRVNVLDELYLPGAQRSSTQVGNR